MIILHDWPRRCEHAMDSAYFVVVVVAGVIAGVVYMAVYNVYIDATNRLC